MSGRPRRPSLPIAAPPPLLDADKKENPAQPPPRRPSFSETRARSPVREISPIREISPEKKERLNRYTVSEAKLPNYDSLFTATFSLQPPPQRPTRDKPTASSSRPSYKLHKNDAQFQMALDGSREREIKQAQRKVRDSARAIALSAKLTVSFGKDHEDKKKQEDMKKFAECFRKEMRKSDKLFYQKRGETVKAWLKRMEVRRFETVADVEDDSMFVEVTRKRSYSEDVSMKIEMEDSEIRQFREGMKELISQIGSLEKSEGSVKSRDDDLAQQKKKALSCLSATVSYSSGKKSQRRSPFNRGAKETTFREIQKGLGKELDTQNLGMDAFSLEDKKKKKRRSLSVDAKGSKVRFFTKRQEALVPSDWKTPLSMEIPVADCSKEFISFITEKTKSYVSLPRDTPLDDVVNQMMSIVFCFFNNKISHILVRNLRHLFCYPSSFNPESSCSLSIRRSRIIRMFLFCARAAGHWKMSLHLLASIVMFCDTIKTISKPCLFEEIARRLLTNWNLPDEWLGVVIRKPTAVWRKVVSYLNQNKDTLEVFFSDVDFLHVFIDEEKIPQFDKKLGKLKFEYSDISPQPPRSSDLNSRRREESPVSHHREKSPVNKQRAKSPISHHREDSPLTRRKTEADIARRRTESPINLQLTSQQNDEFYTLSTGTKGGVVSSCLEIIPDKRKVDDEDDDVNSFAAADILVEVQRDLMEITPSILELFCRSSSCSNTEFKLLKRTEFRDCFVAKDFVMFTCKAFNLFPGVVLSHMNEMLEQGIIEGVKGEKSFDINDSVFYFPPKKDSRSFLEQTVFPPSLFTAKPGVPTTFMDIEVEELAQQITLYEQDMFLDFRLCEFFSGEMSSYDKEVRENVTPNAELIANFQNKLQTWVLTTIVSCKTTSAAAKTLQRMILMAHKLLEMNNFSTSTSIVMCLTRFDLRQNLPKTYSKLSTEAKNLLTTMDQKLKNPTSLFEEAPYPKIPSFFRFSGDSTKVIDHRKEEAGDDKVARKWALYEVGTRFARLILSSQTRLYPFKYNSDIQHYLRDLTTMEFSEVLKLVDSLEGN